MRKSKSKKNSKTDGVRIGHSVGTKKRKEIVIKSIEKKFKMLTKEGIKIIDFDKEKFYF